MKLTNDGLSGLVERLLKFKELKDGGNYTFPLKERVEERLLSVADVKRFLMSQPFVYHKSCYVKYNDVRLTSALSKKRKTDPEGSSMESFTIRTRQQSSAGDENFTTSSEIVCLFCDKGNKYDPKKHEKTKKWKLCAAGGHSSSSSYVDTFTDELRHQASVLGDSRILSKLTTDVRAAELFYHNMCINLFRKR